MTRNEEYNLFIRMKLDEIYKLFETKKEQYGTDEPLANFVRGAQLKYGFDPTDYNPMYDMAKDYLNKHIAFLYTHNIAPKTAESLQDMVVYGLIMLYMVAKQNGWKGEDECGQERAKI